MAAAGKYITSDDLITRLTPNDYIAIYDDLNTNNSATVNDAAVQLDIDMAEGEVDSYLITTNKMPLPVPDRLVKLSALDFATVNAWRRHPEFNRTFGENGAGNNLLKLATDRMKRIQTAIQMLPDVVADGGAKPSNVGGLITNQGPRVFLNGPNGTDNLGDF